MPALRLRVTLATALAASLALPAQAGDILAVDRDGGRLHVIDRDTFVLRHSVAVGIHPHEVIASADGRKAFVAVYGNKEAPGHELVEVDLADGRVVRRIDTTPLQRPHGLARVGDAIWFTAETSRALGRFDPVAGRIDQVHGIGQDVAHMVEASSDGRQLFTADMLSGTVTRIDFRVPQPFPKLTHYPVGERPEGLAVMPDDRHVWVGLNGEGRVRVIDLEGGDPVAEFEAGAQPARIELSGDGRRAFVIDPQASRLLVFDTATHQPLYSHVVDGVPLGMLPDATGGKIVLTLAAAGAVVEVDVASGRVLRRVDVGQVADGLAES